ncbi:MAG: GTP cyclohydrolase II [Dehalococcoidia bacterium]|nr:GTP cyclohydrolase II [Dehalococcoidia bacterium]
MPLIPISQAIDDFRAGKFVIIVDDEDRENEGDLAIAADKVTPESINFMAKYGRGLICLPVIGRRLDELRIPMMVTDTDNTSSFGTAFTVSIEARHKVTTGISAFDRAATVHAVLDPQTRPEDIARPGHMFPLRPKDGGVLVRAGQTEASVDLSRLAGLYPAAVICEIMHEDGTMARMPQLEDFSMEHGINIISVAQLIEYRRHYEKLVRRVAEAQMPTRYGPFIAVAYESMLDALNPRADSGPVLQSDINFVPQHQQHVALVCGDVTTPEPVLVRIHSECLTGDVFGSRRCDCGQQLEVALEMIEKEGRGVLLYMRQEGRGIGLHNKLRAYELQDQGFDTVEANEKLGFAPDLRDYGIGAQILVDLGVREMRLLTNNPKKVVGLEGYGLKVVEQMPIVVARNPHNERYLETKKIKLGHSL